VGHSRKGRFFVPAKNDDLILCTQKSIQKVRTHCRKNCKNPIKLEFLVRKSAAIREKLLVKKWFLRSKNRPAQPNSKKCQKMPKND
jgi:hypothetical protein